MPLILGAPQLAKWRQGDLAALCSGPADRRLTIETTAPRRGVFTRRPWRGSPSQWLVWLTGIRSGTHSSML